MAHCTPSSKRESREEWVVTASGQLQRMFEGLHVGKSALDWHGIRQYVPQRPVLHLYSWQAGSLPGWFTRCFPADYHRKRIVDEQPDSPLSMQPFEKRLGAPLVSDRERAVLEMLSEIGVRQTLQEARELLESTYNLRVDVLRNLLQQCTSIKTICLCLQLGRELNSPWAGKLDPSQLPTGSERPWVSRSPDGLLVPQP